MKTKLFQEYKRNYKNFDKAMECIEKIILIAEKQQNKEICRPIEILLKTLELKGENQ